jgi:hypothetical protein
MPLIFPTMLGCEISQRTARPIGHDTFLFLALLVRLMLSPAVAQVYPAATCWITGTNIPDKHLIYSVPLTSEYVADIKKRKYFYYPTEVRWEFLFGVELNTCHRLKV